MFFENFVCALLTFNIRSEFSIKICEKFLIFYGGKFTLSTLSLIIYFNGLNIVLFLGLVLASPHIFTMESFTIRH